MPGYTYVIYYIADPDEEIPVTQANPSSLIDVFAMSIFLIVEQIRLRSS